MELHSNLIDGQHGCLVLVVVPTAYALLANTPFVSPVHIGNISIHISSTRHAQEELKLQYDKNLQVFHKTRGVELALIQQLVLAVEEKYITSMRKRTTEKYTDTLFILVQYFIFMYG